ncbi:hypothetical protein H8E50_02090 [bacterium]|nr:hypothetical protein [bacterium]
MTIIKKISLIIILIGICLPTASAPFITEFKPHPDLCLSSSFFTNLGTMMVVFGASPAGASAGTEIPWITIPYRYLFSIGVILVCTGLGIMVWTSKPKDNTNN